MTHHTRESRSMSMSSPETRALRLGLLTEPEPLTDLRHQAGHRQTLRPLQSRRASAAPHAAAPLRLQPRHRSQAAVGLGPLHRQLEQRSPQNFRGAHSGKSIHRIAEGDDALSCRPRLVGVCGTRFDSALERELPASASNGAGPSHARPRVRRVDAHAAPTRGRAGFHLARTAI